MKINLLNPKWYINYYKVLPLCDIETLIALCHFMKYGFGELVSLPEFDLGIRAISSGVYRYGQITLPMFNITDKEVELLPPSNLVPNNNFLWHKMWNAVYNNTAISLDSDIYTLARIMVVAKNCKIEFNNDRCAYTDELKSFIRKVKSQGD